MTREEGRANESRWLILICTYCEMANLPSLLEAIGTWAPDAEVLVVDDGSPDGTALWLDRRSAENPRLHWIDRGSKQGLGSAIRDGLRWGAEHHFDWVLNLDADFSHDPKCIPGFLQHEHDRPTLWIGSRYIAGGGFSGCSWRRRWVSYLANRYARLLLRLPVHDTSSAFRAYRLDVFQQLDRLPWQEVGYGFLQEILARWVWTGHPVQELPIVYVERQEGKSKISLREVRSVLSSLHRLAWNGRTVARRLSQDCPSVPR
ncbi:MAG: polyprenol monophosphomannose synthase [Pirellulaceae bacterium]|jgi:dolichol-phosphate mannosyltransferase